MNIQSTYNTAPLRYNMRQAQPDPKEQPPKDKGERPGFLTEAVDHLMVGAKVTLQETVLAAKNDPALAMRVAATGMSDTLLKKVNDPVQKGFQKTIVPVMRFALLGANTARAYGTFKNPHSTKLDRIIDGAVVCSDLVGVIGGIGMLVGGRFSEIGETIVGVNYAVDTVTHAYRTLDHAKNRINVWTAKSKDS